MDELQGKVAAIIRGNPLPVLLGVVGLICLGYGLTTLFEKKPEQDISFISGDKQSAKESAARSTSSGQVLSADAAYVVDVAGAVKKPGIYHLPEESRVGDAITAAGGLNDTADKELIARQFNLAMKVTDGMKLYIPAVGEVKVDNISALSTSQGTADTNQQININTAGEAALDSLPGVGSVTAGKIISGRPYTATDELVTKKIVSQKVFDRIKDRISTY